MHVRVCIFVFREALGVGRRGRAARGSCAKHEGEPAPCCGGAWSGATQAHDSFSRASAARSADDSRSTSRAARGAACVGTGRVGRRLVRKAASHANVGSTSLSRDFLLSPLARVRRGAPSSGHGADVSVTVWEGMSGPDSPSLFSDDAPPAPQPQHVSAADLRATHPRWERAAGRGPPVANGRGGGATSRPASDAGGDRVRFAPLSASALELMTFQADGAESSIAESAPGSVGDRHRAKKKASGRHRRDDDSNEDECDEASDDDGLGADSDLEAPRRRKRGRSEGASGPAGRSDDAAQKAAMLSAAAFGGAYDAHCVSDAESSAGCSQTSSVRRNEAQRAAFPVRGVSCVGCALATKIAPVTRYVNEYASRMAETALWKQAGLCYVREVVEPCRLEGVVAPPWGWREIRAHYTMHVVDERLGRLGTLRLLALMRQQAEQRLLRIETDGNKELDKHTTEQVLKIVNMESRERNLLEASLVAPATGGARSKAKGPKSAE